MFWWKNGQYLKETRDILRRVWIKYTLNLTQ